MTSLMFSTWKSLKRLMILLFIQGIWIRAKEKDAGEKEGRIKEKID